MKLLKLIPAAAITLTVFTTFEAKSENRVCLQKERCFYYLQEALKNYFYRNKI